LVFIAQAPGELKRGKILLVIILFLALTTFLFGCATYYGKRDPETKHALFTLTGGVMGILLAEIP